MESWELIHGIGFLKELRCNIENSWQNDGKTVALTF